jgi:hypothetical protein
MNCKYLNFLRQKRAQAFGYANKQLEHFTFKGRINNLVRVCSGGNPSQAPEALLIVCGNGMNQIWAQIWSILSLAAIKKRYAPFVLARKGQSSLLFYFKTIGAKVVYLEDYVDHHFLIPAEIRDAVKKSLTIEDVKKIYYRNAPIGEIALSTYSRNNFTGLIDLADSDVKNQVEYWVELIIRFTSAADAIYVKYNVKALFFTEVFMEEYGAFYYAALLGDLNVMRFAGTVRDDAIIVQHLNSSNDRTHHASISQSTWSWVKEQPLTVDIDEALSSNFIDRYGEKWLRSLRNHPGTIITNPIDTRAKLGITNDKKIAVIYSHILYDTLFFFGKDLFEDYSEWLIETVKAACKNDKINWLIKVHPSNLWRGELSTFLKGKYEEERLIQEKIGELPDHVQIVPATTEINPYALFKLADFGITVRGTAGLEMAAIGKTVITAGTGRYEGNGFTVDPQDKEEYLKVLSELPDIERPTVYQIELAKKYAYSIFVLKPFRLQSIEFKVKNKKNKVLSSDDINYHPKKIYSKNMPEDLQIFSDWLVQVESQDLLNKWGAK